jgi:hypothetical protein
MLPVCTQLEKVRSSIPHTDPDLETALAPVKASNCPSVEECKKCMGIFESIDSQLKELATRRKTLLAMRASVAESISAFLSCHDKEEISTKDNRLHLKLETKVKPVPLKKKELAAKMLAAFDGDQDRFDEFNHKIYNDQRTVKKVTLKRLKTKPMPMQLS